VCYHTLITSVQVEWNLYALFRLEKGRQK